MSTFMRNILVTGGAGFIGSNFIRYLLAHYPESRVYNLDALTYAGSRSNLMHVESNPQYTFFHHDICDADVVNRLFTDHDIDTVVHFAAESHVDRSIAGPDEFVRTNVVGTFVLLEAARTAWSNHTNIETSCRFHHVSTDEVYGSLGNDDPPFCETHPYQPNSPYSATKAGSDHLARAYWKTYGLPITISNCSNNYGPCQHDEKLIPTIIRACLLNQPIRLYGDGQNIRDWLYVDDHCAGIDVVLSKGRIGNTYNIGGDCEMSNIDLALVVCKLMDELRPAGSAHADKIEFVQDRLGHDWRYAVDTSRIRSELDWLPEHSFEVAIRKTIEWYLDNAK